MMLYTLPLSLLTIVWLPFTSIHFSSVSPVVASTKTPTLAILSPINTYPMLWLNITCITKDTINIIHDIRVHRYIVYMLLTKQPKHVYTISANWSAAFAAAAIVHLPALRSLFICDSRVVFHLSNAIAPYPTRLLLPLRPFSASAAVKNPETTIDVSTNSRGN